MNYKQKVKNFLTNKKEKKKFEKLIKEEKSDFSYSNNDKREDDIYHQELENVKNDPSLRKFLERYNYVNKKKIQKRFYLQENENREEIFLEITERIKSIKDQHNKTK